MPRGVSFRLTGLTGVQILGGDSGTGNGLARGSRDSARQRSPRLGPGETVAVRYKAKATAIREHRGKLACIKQFLKVLTAVETPRCLTRILQMLDRNREV